MRLTDDYQYVSEEEQQISKNSDKKELPKKLTKDDWIKFNEWIKEKEKDINSELLQEHFRYQRPSDMLQDLYRINDKKKNNEPVNLTKSGLSNLKNEIENIDEEEKEIEKPNEIVNIVE